MTPKPDLSLALFCDLYELTMAQAYLAHGMTEDATFSLFVRKLPPARNVLIACGQDSLLDLISQLSFGDEEIAYLASLGSFSDDFLAWLGRYRFRGDIFAVREGTPLFANEPILEVTAPIAEAQLLETLIINQIQLPTILASKAWRVACAADGREVVDFGSRRAQGVDAALSGARAFYIAGVNATSNLLAGAQYGIPVAGTMAHSFIQACDTELEAFRRFASVYPETALLVDTYDTLTGVQRVLKLAEELGPDFRVRGVRLDSGDLLALSRGARKMLDEAGLASVRIFASGGLDEFKVAELVAAGAPINAFGVGTDMSVSADAPALDIAYKLCAFRGEGRLKLSSGKRTLPGRKQVFRGQNGDMIGLAEEDLEGERLLAPAMRRGEIVARPCALDDIRSDTAKRLTTLPQKLRRLEPAADVWSIAVSERLLAYEQEVIRKIRDRA